MRATDEPREHAGPARRPAAKNVVDSDVDLHDPAQRAETRPREWDLLAAIAVGGAAGAEGRYGIELALPHAVGSFPWATVLVNASGCLAIGVLMAVLARAAGPRRLARAFLGVGVLGGYTTYSTFALDTRQLLVAHRPASALGYVLLTFAAGLLAVVVGTAATARLAPARRAAEAEAVTAR